MNYRATHVPVGADQSQHLEFARECANGFNHNFQYVLVPPETILCTFPSPHTFRANSMQPPQDVSCPLLDLT